MWGLARFAGRINPLLGSIVNIFDQAYQTSKSIQDSYDILLDSNASAEEKQMAGYTAIFALANYGFQGIGIAASSAQEMLMARNGTHVQADAENEAEMMSPGDPKRRTVMESRKSRLSARDQSEGNTLQYRRTRTLNEGPCGSYRFLPDTPVFAADSSEDITKLPVAENAKATTSNVKPIAEVRVGDPVISRNADTGKTEWKRVTAVHSRTTYEVVYLHLSDKSGKAVETLGTTAEHPFMTPAGWMNAGSLGIGTEIVTRAGPSLVVSKVERVNKPEGVTVYNFTVDGDHTYFVGNDNLGGVLSHNAKPCGSEKVDWIRHGERKPDYEHLNHHVPGTTGPDGYRGKPGDGVLPRDAEQIYRRAVPHPNDPDTWFGIDNDGNVQRYQTHFYNTETGQKRVHWNGGENTPRGLADIPQRVQNRLDYQRVQRGLKPRR